VVLQTRRADITIANFTNTVERSTVIAFTEPYVVVGSIFMVLKNSPLQTVEQLNDPKYKIGYPRGGTAEQIAAAAALAQQWGCPLFPLDHQTAHPAWSSLVPLPLLDSARAVPAHASPDGRVVHLAFGERIDHQLLYAVEHMLACRTVACVAPETKIIQFLTYWRRRVERNEINFDTIREPREMTRTIRNYALELEAKRLSVARASAHIWVRFFGRYGSRDLLFRIVSDPRAPLSNWRSFGGRSTTT